MEKLVVLDYVTPSVHIYDVVPGTEVDEVYISQLGFNHNNCSWMVGEGMDIIIHKGVLK